MNAPCSCVPIKTSDAVISFRYLSPDNGSQRDQVKVLVQAGELGKQLLPRYKLTFPNKQIVCIEYMEIAGDEECDISWVSGVSTLRFQFLILFKYRVQLGMSV